MKYRDLNLVSWDEENYLVISCDSAGGIGNKAGDVIKTEPKIVGYYTAQVALMEMLSIRVYPFFLCNTLSVEMNPTGLEVLQGIKEALDVLDLGDKVEITGTTEENIQSSSTGVGITLMGRILKKDFKLPKTHAKDVAVVVGIPVMGEEVLMEDDSTKFNLKAMGRILGKDYIHELIPGGSRGIAHEIKELERRENLSFKKTTSENIDLTKSAGPATSVLITLQKDNLEKLKKDLAMPLMIIGEFLSREESED